MSTNEPFISVVTPVYNTADYLREAIESVLAQSYGNFEYIISDNCSTDGSSEIAHEYERLDKRVRVADHAEFLPQGGNYNRAMRLISPAAKYCKMVQADDWIFPDSVRELVRVAELDPAIAIVGSYQLAGSHVQCRGLVCNRPSEPYTMVSGREACRMYLLEGKYLFGTPNCLLYRADLVRGRERFFREDSIHDDSELCFEVLGQYKFGFVHSILSSARLGNPSTSSDIEDFFPDLRHAYIIMVKYGRLHLTEAEYAYHLERTRKEHYRWLAYNVFRRRDKRFWDFQEEGFRIAGDRLKWRTLLLLQVPRVGRLIGNPLSTLQSAAQLVIGRLRRRDASPIE
jgi:glycosyltransferase involved in cell wall biosynthesis